MLFPETQGQQLKCIQVRAFFFWRTLTVYRGGNKYNRNMKYLQNTFYKTRGSRKAISYVKSPFLCCKKATYKTT